MRVVNLISLLLLYWSVGFAQPLYTSLNHSNYRNYEPFSDTIDINNFDAARINACVFFATNEIRAKKNLSILSYHTALEKSSTLHSEDMVNLNFFSHTNNKIKKHREPNDRAKIVGIENPHLAENIIEGFILKYNSGDAVVADSPGVFLYPESNKKLIYHSYITLTDKLLELWMGSKGHRANILSENGVELGCGTILYFMNDFNEMPAVKATQNFQWYEKVKFKSD